MRKIIVVLQRNELVRAKWKFLLETRGYQVQTDVEACDREPVAIVTDKHVAAHVPVLVMQPDIPALSLLEQVRNTLRG